MILLSNNYSIVVLYIKITSTATVKMRLDSRVGKLFFLTSVAQTLH